MGGEIVTAFSRGSDDSIRGPADSEQRSVDPSGAEIGAKNFPGCVNWKSIGIPPKVDFPAFRAENFTIRLPFLSQAGEDPESHGFLCVCGYDGEPEAGIGKTSELAQAGHHDGAVAASGLFWPMICGHFRKDEAG